MKKSVSKKAPIILAIVWLVVGMGVVMGMIPKMILMEGVFADWNVQMLVFLAEMVFSVGMMIAIRILSARAQIKWMAILSKILLIVYSAIGGIGLLVFIVIKLAGM